MTPLKPEKGGDVRARMASGGTFRSADSDRQEFFSDRSLFFEYDGVVYIGIFTVSAALFGFVMLRMMLRLLGPMKKCMSSVTAPK